MGAQGESMVTIDAFSVRKVDGSSRNHYIKWVAAQVDYTTWKVNKVQTSGFTGGSDGITLLVDPVTGQLSYQSDTMAGTNYTGTMEMVIWRTI
jgi:hypothetical protein